jgi:hypothetical protein
MKLTRSIGSSESVLKEVGRFQAFIVLVPTKFARFLLEIDQDSTGHRLQTIETAWFLSGQTLTPPSEELRHYAG